MTPARCVCGAPLPRGTEALGCLECGVPCCPCCGWFVESVWYCTRCAGAFLEVPAARWRMDDASNRA